MSPTIRRRRGAARLARVLRPAADAAGAWVSAEAAVRVIPDQIWEPAVIVSTADLPPDGVVDGPPLVAVELDGGAFDRWRHVPLATVWAVVDGRVAIVHDTRVTHVQPDAMMTVPGHDWLTLPATALLAAATGA
ncbi:MAG: hypothetical protein GEU74_06020 [Nitriliruptorales bacterium]|nr:hypothetical protein [Nitriliruptorales bacterium]